MLNTAYKLLIQFWVMWAARLCKSGPEKDLTNHLKVKNTFIDKIPTAGTKK